MTVAEIRKIISNHNYYASNLMNTTTSTPTNTALAYKRYIDEAPVISEILKEIVVRSQTAEELFVVNKSVMSFSMRYSNDEIEMMAMYYKHLGEMSEENFDLQNHAYWTFRRKSFNDSIRELLNQTVYPVIQYIDMKLKEVYTDIEEQERAKMQPNIHIGDNITESVVQKDNEGKSVIKNSGNDKHNKHFNFQKESFFLGILSAVVSGLVVWGITELIKYIIGA